MKRTISRFGMGLLVGITIGVSADSLPVGDYIAESFLKPFIPSAEQISGGAVGVDYFPAEQPGNAKDMLSLTQTGVADIGYVGASYVADKLPLSSVAQLPGTFSTSCEGAMAYWGLARLGGVLDTAEYAPEGAALWQC